MNCFLELSEEYPLVQTTLVQTETQDKIKSFVNVPSGIAWHLKFMVFVCRLGSLKSRLHFREDQGQTTIHFTEAYIIL